jgi:ABC-type multidrug transport system fused ATPase/permease subunit
MVCRSSGDRQLHRCVPHAAVVLARNVWCAHPVASPAEAVQAVSSCVLSGFAECVDGFGVRCPLTRRGTIALQRLFSTSRSPVFSHFSETLAGVATIRAFGATDRFVAHNVALLDVNAKAMYLLRALFRWATLRIEMLNSLATFAVALLVVSNKDSIKPAFAGAILNFALSTGGILGFAVIVATELEVQMNAVERTQFYTHQIPQERPRVVPSADPGPSWPSEGRVVFEDVQMRYREGLEPALQRLSTEVAGGSKVGVRAFVSCCCLLPPFAHFVTSMVLLGGGPYRFGKEHVSA